MPSFDVIDIRKAILADARGIADVHVAVWRTTYAGIVAQSYLDSLDVDECCTAWESRLSTTSEYRSEIFVAGARGEIVGFVAGGPCQVATGARDAQLHAIYLRSEAQGQGVGRRLAATWVAAAVGRGWASAIVDVLARNSARGFYERLGAQYVEDIEVVIGADRSKESRYQWPDLRALAS